MAKQTPLINIFTYSLPFVLANQIYNEYQDRLRELNYIIDHYDRYKPMKQYLKTVEILLALSIFHKRVISNLDGAIKFYRRITTKSDAEVISIGSYELNSVEKNKILALLINYEKLMERFQISPNILSYNLTVDFLKNVKNLKLALDEESNQKSKRGKNNQNEEEDIPF